MSDELNSFLKSKFEELKNTNPRFSLRGLAQRLDMSPGHLSEIFNAKRPLSKKVLEKLVKGLHLSENENAHVLALYSDQIKYSLTRSATEIETPPVGNIDFYLVLAALDLPGAGTDKESLAQKTGMSLEETEQALASLQKLGLLEERDGRWVKRRNGTGNGETSHNIQKFYLDGLERIKRICAEVSPQDREIVYITMAVNPEKLPMAKKELEKCWRKVYQKFSEGECSEVYTLGIQLLPGKKTG
ncbi:DUF4423 domain-containing protein [uncultured Bdellovibrio sp.]|uniref:DUF4423 domain-containing protein n=1 Tax=Bdellovibrio sp. HCB-162 TaxID=3394234 RepID=UPI0025E6836A|nr:DUF4423 domain-containing protein [uncultured Bdellovibrio sp.]